jgi:hypothetical protein
MESLLLMVTKYLIRQLSATNAHHSPPEEAIGCVFNDSAASGKMQSGLTPAYSGNSGRVAALDMR